jgi:hypothetical protein
MTERDPGLSAEAPEDGDAGSPILGIVRSGLVAALLHPLSSSVTVACLVAMLAPLLAGLGIARGLADAAETSIDAGADLHVSGIRYGRAAPVPLAADEILRAIPGVESAEPRIVGAVELGSTRQSVVVVGVREEALVRRGTRRNSNSSSAPNWPRVSPCARGTRSRPSTGTRRGSASRGSSACSAPARLPGSRTSR